MRRVDRRKKRAVAGDRSWMLIGLLLYKWAFCAMAATATIHGRYTKSLTDYHLSIPHKLTAEGEFSTFHLPHFHDHMIERYKDREKRSSEDPELIHYGVALNDNLYHLELWPNRDFVHPGLVVEDRDPTLSIKDRKVRTMRGKKLCHYTGRVRNVPSSRVALSTCDGLAGHMVIGNKKYFIEPVDDHSPNAEGHHLHVVYDKVPKGRGAVCGTEDTWEDAMKKRFRQRLLDGEDIFKAKRGTESVARYLEVGVVCDKTFLSYHKIRDVELYVMTVMNMVADYYHDASVGHQMDVVVVRIIYLSKEEEEIDLEINRDSAKTLRSFCDWAIKINTPEDSPNHFDLAVLLTRYDLCAEGEEDCDLSGLAFLGGACSKNEQCGINEDSGLILSVIVAHEVGHLMGADHDEQSTPCPVQDTDGSYFVMSPIVSTYTIRWSSCSRSMISTLIANDLAECLTDVPESETYPFSDNMPGVVYDVNEQCIFMIPASVGVCGGVKEKICEELICKLNAKECVGKNQVPADGTKCAENKWCFRKKCVEMGARPEAVNGGWGEFGPWSECSRSCGGGVSHSERDCDNPVPANKGRYCLGERRKIKICNTQPCPDDDPTFRQQQCTAHNSVPWNDQYHTWTASFREDEPCALYCISEEKVLSQLEPAAKDGTLCKYGTKNMCISGSCRTVGCDNVLDSEAVEDHCGVCNGDGTQCKIVEETYKDVGHGYTKVVVIPAGARKVVIEENGPSMNILAITDSSEKKFYLNGDHTEFLDGQYNLGKVIGVYTHVEPTREKLIINGPLKDDLVLFVYFASSENPGYSYRWAEPTVDSSYEPQYHWEIGEFEDCPVLCGGGTTAATINCMEERSGKVSANFCAGLDKPKEQVKTCNDNPCKNKWKVGSWGQCRACRGKGGVRTRSVECVQETPRKGADDILVEDMECEGPKPGSVELCQAAFRCDRKRTASFIPGKYQGTIWKQMHGRFKRKKVVEVDDEKGTTKGFTAKIGKFIHDFVPVEDQILIKYTVKPNPMRKNLSDGVQAEMGDKIGDVIDMQHRSVFTGKQAVKMNRILGKPTNATIAITCNKEPSNED